MGKAARGRPWLIGRPTPGESTRLPSPSRGGASCHGKALRPAGGRRQRPGLPAALAAGFPQPGLGSAPPAAFAEAPLTPHKTSTGGERLPRAGRARPGEGGWGRGAGSPRETEEGAAGTQIPFPSWIFCFLGSGFAGRMCPFAQSCTDMFYFHLESSIKSQVLVCSRSPERGHFLGQVSGSSSPRGGALPALVTVKWGARADAPTRSAGQTRARPLWGPRSTLTGGAACGG